MKNSKIEWTDHTFNPWYGCTKVSPGCANCYAESWALAASGVEWGKGKERKRASEAKWREPIQWNREAILAPAGTPRPRVFCASLADWLDDEVPVEWLLDLLDLIRCTPNLDWLLLTKRPQNWEDRMMAAEARITKDLRYDHGLYMYVAGWLRGNFPANVWIGTTIEDQKRADERIPELVEIRAAVRFLSCEPLLGPVDLSYYTTDPVKSYIDWVICGGESGKAARPMHPDWARELRDSCMAASIPFLFKQWGEWGRRGENGLTLDHAEGDLSSMGYWQGNDPWRTGLTGSADEYMVRVGKHAAGRLLDGVEHTEFPKGGRRG